MELLGCGKRGLCVCAHFVVGRMRACVCFVVVACVIWFECSSCVWWLVLGGHKRVWKRRIERACRVLQRFKGVTEFLLSVADANGYKLGRGGLSSPFPPLSLLFCAEHARYPYDGTMLSTAFFVLLQLLSYDDEKDGIQCVALCTAVVYYIYTSGATTTFTVYE